MNEYVVNFPPEMNKKQNRMVVSKKRLKDNYVSIPAHVNERGDRGNDR